jgi:huntingtin
MTKEFFVFRFYLTNKQRKTIEHLKRPPNRNERTKIGSYIRLFEGVVILSLKKYVNSNESEFQASALDLLVQLLLLRVNYSLLDSDEVCFSHFFKF